MCDVFFYQDKRGKEPVWDYIESLINRGDKDSRIKATKIRDYIKYLRQEGMRAGEPSVKNLGDGIYELRPLRDRILYAAWDGNSFILLQHFMKKTNKTPILEIEQAKRNLEDYTRRHSI